MTYLELSHPISVDTPVYPGDPKVTIEAAGVLAKNGSPCRVIAQVDTE